MTNRFLGIDGCRGGWFAVINDGDQWHFEMAASLNRLFNGHTPFERAFVDIPIGLAGDTLRQCDLQARQLLSPVRHNSVFTTPVRDAVYARDYISACAINARHTGKKLSKQTWNICPKIREMDVFLRENPGLQTKIFESHPEVAFYTLNGYMPLARAKKTPEGRAQRLGLIKRHIKKAPELFDTALKHYPRKYLQPDDILDAMALANIARLRDECLLYLPAQPEYDDCNLPMRIVYGRL